MLGVGIVERGGRQAWCGTSKQDNDGEDSSQGPFPDRRAAEQDCPRRRFTTFNYARTVAISQADVAFVANQIERIVKAIDDLVV